MGCWKEIPNGVALLLCPARTLARSPLGSFRQVESRSLWLFVLPGGARSAALAIYVLRRFSVPSSFLSETHCFYSPSNLGVSLVSLTVILMYIILVFRTIRNIFY